MAYRLIFRFAPCMLNKEVWNISRREEKSAVGLSLIHIFHSIETTYDACDVCTILVAASLNLLDEALSLIHIFWKNIQTRQSESAKRLSWLLRPA